MPGLTPPVPTHVGGVTVVSAVLETDVLHTLSRLPDGGRSLCARLVAQARPVELAAGGRWLGLFLDPASGVLFVYDPPADAADPPRWQRLRRAALRDYLARNLADWRTAFGRHSARLDTALRYPRPALRAAEAVPALAQLAARAAARLESSETAASKAARAGAPPAGARSAGDEAIARIQDALFDAAAEHAMPTAFPLAAYPDLAVLVRAANPPARARVSLVLPVRADPADSDPATARATPGTTAAILHLDLTPAEVMAAIRSSTLVAPAQEVLEDNGLSLSNLLKREARSAAASLSGPTDD